MDNIQNNNFLIDEQAVLEHLADNNVLCTEESMKINQLCLNLSYVNTR
jgi:hypothetical protein